jgi:predicted RNase H-like nuclease (RuvC/YqgF family)
MEQYNQQPINTVSVLPKNDSRVEELIHHIHSLKDQVERQERFIRRLQTELDRLRQQVNSR